MKAPNTPTAAERDSYHDVYRIGFWLLVGKKPGPYVPREPVLNPGRITAAELHAYYRPERPVVDPVERAHLSRCLEEALNPPPTPMAPESEVRKKPIGIRPCRVCGVPFHSRIRSQISCSRRCGGVLRSAGGRALFSDILAEQKARVAALKVAGCSLTTPTVSDSPPARTSASPTASPPELPASPAEASGQ